MFVLGDSVLHVLPVNDREGRPESRGVSSRMGVRGRAVARQERPADKRCHISTHKSVWAEAL